MRTYTRTLGIGRSSDANQIRSRDRFDAYNCTSVGASIISVAEIAIPIWDTARGLVPKNTRSPSNTG